MGTIWCAPAATIGRGTIVVRVADGATERLARRFTSLTGASLTITRRCLPVLALRADQLDGRALGLPEEAERTATIPSKLDNGMGFRLARTLSP